jgi:hypothetical protein
LPETSAAIAVAPDIIVAAKIAVFRAFIDTSPKT